MKAESNQKRPFLSLRVKIWFVYLTVFFPLFAGMYYWYYTYSINRELNSLTQDLTLYVDGVVNNIDAEAFRSLYEGEAARNENCPPPAGTPFNDPKNGYFPEDNPLFIQHMEWLRTVTITHPERSIYTYIKGPEKDTVIVISSSWYFTNPEESFKFCQLYTGPTIYKGLEARFNKWEPYTDEYGSWITTYSPIMDKNGVIVGAFGVDVPAQQVLDIERELKQAILPVFGATLLISLLAIFGLTRIISEPLSRLTKLTEQIIDGSSSVNFSGIKRTGELFLDEIDELVSTSQSMMERLNKQAIELSESRANMQELAHGVIRSQEAERKYISRELHDEAAQLLVSLKMTMADALESLPQYRSDKTRLPILEERLHNAINQIEKTLGIVRAISHNLRPPLLDIGDLNDALKGYCQDYSQQHSIRLEFKGTVAPEPPEETAISLFRFLQESLTNIAKHSSATKVRVILKTENNWIEISVEDNGAISELAANSGGIGIKGLKERFFLLGGSVEHGITEWGFRITARAPFPVDNMIQ